MICNLGTYKNRSRRWSARAGSNHSLLVRAFPKFFASSRVSGRFFLKVSGRKSTTIPARKASKANVKKGTNSEKCAWKENYRYYILIDSHTTIRMELLPKEVLVELTSFRRGRMSRSVPSKYVYLQLAKARLCVHTKPKMPICSYTSSRGTSPLI